MRSGEFFSSEYLDILIISLIPSHFAMYLLFASFTSRFTLLNYFGHRFQDTDDTSRDA